MTASILIFMGVALVGAGCLVGVVALILFLASTFEND
jgi:hypothetical protein